MPSLVLIVLITSSIGSCSTWGVMAEGPVWVLADALKERPIRIENLSKGPRRQELRGQDSVHYLRNRPYCDCVPDPGSHEFKRSAGAASIGAFM